MRKFSGHRYSSAKITCIRRAQRPYLFPLLFPSTDARAMVGAHVRIVQDRAASDEKGSDSCGYHGTHPTIVRGRHTSLRWRAAQQGARVRLREDPKHKRGSAEVAVPVG